MGNSHLVEARRLLECANQYLVGTAPRQDLAELALAAILRYLEERHEAGRAPQVVPESKSQSQLPEVTSTDAMLEAAKLDAAAEALDLDALQRLCDAATPGPWDCDCGDYDTLFAPDGQAVAIMGGYRDAGTHQRNARFVAAARDALPKLIAEARRLRMRADRLPDALSGFGIDSITARAIMREIERGEHG